MSFDKKFGKPSTVQILIIRIVKKIDVVKNESFHFKLYCLLYSLGANKTGKTRGLCARKLSFKPNESLHDQKPEATHVQVSTSISSAAAVGTSFTANFEYGDNAQAAYKDSGRNQVISHVNPPTSTSFFAYYGMENEFHKKTSSSFKVQVKETDEARKKFSNAKSISSSQYFGDQNKGFDNQGITTISSVDLFGDKNDDFGTDFSASDLINQLSFQDIILHGS
ncbi:putative ADP-ribosylation factor GTPase-activating protein AGD8 [Apium graveolens]|uniref:putative ADP-ribosylation factor GTPase-activating protein AGD8 n=1 Tax=Apium graveolens TaxID=4045 RepID=UPI003D7B1C43